MHTGIHDAFYVRVSVYACVWRLCLFDGTAMMHGSMLLVGVLLLVLLRVRLRAMAAFSLGPSPLDSTPPPPAAMFHASDL